jgi:hypothetical protein
VVLTRKIVVSSIAFFVLVAIAIAVVVGIRAVQLFLRHLLVVRFSKILLLAVI